MIPLCLCYMSQNQTVHQNKFCPKQKKLLHMEVLQNRIYGKFTTQISNVVIKEIKSFKAFCFSVCGCASPGGSVTMASVLALLVILLMQVPFPCLTTPNYTKKNLVVLYQNHPCGYFIYILCMTSELVSKCKHVH